MSADAPIVTRIAEGAYRVELNGRASIVYVAAVDGRRQAWWNGQRFDEDTAIPKARSHTRRAANETLAAPMPATVIKVLVAVGDRIAKGQTAVVLEAMKMEWPVKATDEAVVARINCRAGELVQAGAALVELEPA